MSLLNISNVEVSFDQSNIQGKIDALVDDSVLTEIQTLFADTIDPWTPFLTGALHSDLTIEPDGVTYNVPYSAEKYYGYVFHKEEHPLATDHWDKVAMESQMDTFEEQVKEILVRRAKELYG